MSFYVNLFPDYVQACSDTATRPPLDTNWVYSPICNASNEMCQIKGLEHTSSFNISCYRFGIFNKLRSCYETCTSLDTDDRKECSQRCSGMLWLAHFNMSVYRGIYIIIQKSKGLTEKIKRPKRNFPSQIDA